MSTALATRPLSLFDGPGGEPTLDELIAGVWEGLTVHGTVSCPVCGETMRPQYAHQSRPIGGRCDACDSVLR
jgi:hypothetical protein